MNGSCSRWDRWALGAVLVWLSFVIHGTRMPWTPIVESEGNSGSGIRQLVFAGCAGVLVLRCWALGRSNDLIAVGGRWILTGAYLMATLLYAELPELTAKRSVLFLMGVLVLSSSVTLARDPRALLHRGVTAVIGAHAWVALATMVVFPAEHWSLASRPGLAGTSSHPNTFGPALALGLILSLGLRSCAWILIAQVGMVAALLKTNSMGSIALACVGCWIFFWLRCAPRVRIGLLAVGLGAIVAVFVAGPDWVTGEMLSGVGRDRSLSGRDQLWAAVFAEFQRSPGLGDGYGSFWYEGRGREIVGTWNPRQSHNAWLDVLVEVGMLGFLLLIALVGLRPWLAGGGGDRDRCARLAAVLALVLVASWAESFLLKMDKLQFFLMAWILILEGADPRNLRSQDARGTVTAADRESCRQPRARWDRDLGADRGLA